MSNFWGAYQYGVLTIKNYQGKRITTLLKEYA